MHRILRCFLLSLVLGSSLSAAGSGPAYVLRVPDSIGTVFIADTSKFALHRYDSTSETGVTHSGASYMSIGQKGAGKQRAGDLRTPLGIYFVTEQLDTERMHEKYGITAFVLDYPNTLDKKSNKTGDGIWLHGVDARAGRRPALDTDGCLALPNEELALIEPLMVPNLTPVIVVPKMQSLPQERIDELRVELEDRVAEWSVSLGEGDLHAYLSLYSEDFRHWGMDKSEWSAVVLATIGARPITATEVSGLLLLADPVENDLYLSRFKLTMTEGSRKFVSTKRLYWRRSPSGALRIVAEDVG